MSRHTILVIFTVCFLGFAAAQCQATIVSQWIFNSATGDANTATGVISPSTGSGTFAVIGGTTNTFATGSPGDPASGGNDNSGFNATTFPAQGAGSGTAGVKVAASTVGFTNIALSLD